jgi:hypothetical protein
VNCQLFVNRFIGFSFNEVTLLFHKINSLEGEFLLLMVYIRDLIKSEGSAYLQASIQVISLLAWDKASGSLKVLWNRNKLPVILKVTIE